MCKQRENFSLLGKLWYEVGTFKIISFNNLNKYRKWFDAF